MSDIKIRHTGAEWLAIDRWVKAEQEEKGVRGPKTVAAEAEAHAVYKAARQAEITPPRIQKVEKPVEKPVEAPVEAPVKAPVKKIEKKPLPPSKPLARQVTAAPPSVKNSRLAAKRAEILAKMPTIKKTDLTGLDDWVDPNDPYNGCDYESP